MVSHFQPIQWLGGSDKRSVWGIRYSLYIPFLQWEAGWSDESRFPTILSGWWFGTFFIFPYIGNNHPNWLIFFRQGQVNQPSHSSDSSTRGQGYDFLALDHLDFAWQISVNGLVVEKGTLEGDGSTDHRYQFYWYLSHGSHGFMLMAQLITMASCLIILKMFEQSCESFRSEMIAAVFLINRYQRTGSLCTNSSSAYKAIKFFASVLAAWQCIGVSPMTNINDDSAPRMSQCTKVPKGECHLLITASMRLLFATGQTRNESRGINWNKPWWHVTMFRIGKVPAYFLSLSQPNIVLVYVL